MQCKLTVATEYVQRPTYVFSTMGLVGSGKTECMAKVVDLLPSVGLGFKPVEDSAGVKALRTWRGSPTRAGVLPEPALFTCPKTAWTGPSALLNIGDYSGEALGPKVLGMEHPSAALEHPIRERLLAADGYLFFLALKQDPNHAWRRQLEELRRVEQNLDVSSKAIIPFAICCSFIDTLDGKIPPIAQRAVDAIVQTYHREPDTLDESLLNIRSSLTLAILQVLWPGFSIEEFAEKYTQWKLFPVASRIDNPTFAARVPNPFGAVEAVLWLLHMNGFDVFPVRKTSHERLFVRRLRKSD